MSKAVQRRRGTTAEHTTFTGAVAELTVDTTKDTLVVHDGAAAGGYPLLREDGSNSALAIGSAGTPSLKFTGDLNTGLYSPGADQVAISTGGSERARIDANGKVLVGTSSAIGTRIGVTPLTAPFQVAGTSFNTNSALLASYNTGASGSSYLTFARSKSATLGTNTAVILNDRLGGFSFAGYDGASQTEGARIAVDVDGTPGTDSMPGRLVFSTTANGGSSPTERMRIGSTGAVAIGTTTTIGGANGCSLRFANDLTGATAPVSILGTPQILADATLSASVFVSQPGASVTGATLGDVRHFVANAFSIGAGTTAANQFGFLATGSLTAATNNYGFRSNIDAGTGRWAFYADGTADSYFASNSFIFANGGTERARLDSSGRLLVGTSSDSGGALFQVNGDRIRVGTAKTPATSGATGTTGEIAWDADYIYVCTATNTWKRSAIATW